jgi:5-formyltetrahydrofolate cyclo-ligase
MTDAKRELRRQVRAARGGLGLEARACAASAVAARLLSLPEIAGARAVLAYAATGEELDPAPVVAALRARGVRIAYPRVCGPGEISLHWAADEELRPGYCGILEPVENAESASIDDIDLVLVPGVAYDGSCRRLGMGGGFYDRLLPNLPAGSIAVGLAFDEQVVSEIPCESHDVALAIVVTPTRTLRRARRLG